MDRSTRFGLALFAALACHCGSEPGELGGADATTAAALLSVRVVDDGIPVAGARVVFHSPDGQVAGLVVADANGRAEYEVVAGSLVTVAHPNEITSASPYLQLITFTGVEPGGELTLEIPWYGLRRPERDYGRIAGSVRVQLPPQPDAGFFVVQLGCMDVRTEEIVTVIDIPEACLGSDNYVDITVQAFSPPEVAAALGTTFARGVVVSPGSVTDVVMRPWIAELPTLDVELSGVPDETSYALAVATMRVDGFAFAPLHADSLTAPDAERITLSPRFLREFADQMDLEVRLSAGGDDRTSFYRLASPVEQFTALDGDSLLPTVRDIGVDAEGTTISWTATGELSHADATFLHLRSERREGGLTWRRRWTVITSPGGPSTFVLPELPSDLEAYRPSPLDTFMSPGIVTFDVDWVSGYREFLRDHGTRFLDDPCVPDYTTARITRTGVFYGPVVTSRAY